MYNNKLYYFHKSKDYNDALEYLKENGYPDGYADCRILNSVAESTDKVLKGLGLYEQDGIVYNKEHNNYELLFALFYIYARNKRLHVLDYGGALGSNYYRYKKIFPESTEWVVVEQKNYVEYGKKNIEEISFYYDLQECLREREIDVILLSGVLQYFNNPYQEISRICNSGIKFILVDETSFGNGLEGEVFIQHIPKEFYGEEQFYPVHLFEKMMFLDCFEKNGYRKRFEWLYDGKGIGIPIIDEGRIEKTFDRGFLFERM